MRMYSSEWLLQRKGKYDSRVKQKADSGNRASIKVLMKCGLQSDGEIGKKAFDLLFIRRKSNEGLYNS